MDNKLLNKAITINGKEEKLQGGKPVVKLKDEKGLTYTVYKTKQDGSISVAWDQLRELSVGDTVQIGFVEQQGEYEGKAVTYRTIRSFNRDIGEGVKNHQSHNPAPQAQSSNVGRSVRSQGKPETDWDQIAVGKCQTAFLAAYLQAGNTFADAKLQAVQARKLAELVVFGTQQTEELPTINQDDDPAGGLNPFVNDEPPIEAFGEDIPY